WARARRSVSGLEDTSTIRARPCSSTCVRRPPGSVLTQERAPHRVFDQLAHLIEAPLAQQLDGIRLALHDRLEELLAVFITRKRGLCPPTGFVQEHGQHRVRLAEKLADLPLHPLGQRG